MSSTIRRIPDNSQTDQMNRQASIEFRRDRDQATNINGTERWTSTIGGGLLALYGLKRKGWGGALLALLGGGLIYRGTTGHCNVYGALGVNTSEHKGARASVKHGEGVKIEKSVTVNKSPEELYSFWRNFENLPRIMRHLESVRVIDNKRSHWTAKAPAGTTAEWDAEIINERTNEMIAWRSLEGSSVPNAGSVHFVKSPGGRGTEVKVALNYDPPGGTLGVALARLFGEEPGQQVEEDLHRFKQMMESGEVLSTKGQPSGQGAKAK
jgi:uncharacterized membrane protein